MERIHIHPDDIYNISPLLEGIMDLAFDESCIMDRNGYIIHCSKSSPQIWGRPNSESIGMHISELDSASPYPELLRTGKAIMGRAHIINGMTCITHMIPLFDYEDNIIGAFGVIILRGVERVKQLIRDASSKSALDQHTKNLYNQLTRASPTYSLSDFLGETPEVQQLISLSKRAAEHECPVLIRGETGCGKEIIANGIHAASPVTRGRQFVKINCTAIPHDLLESELFGYEKGAFSGAYSTKIGKFELAGNGTILLDEIGDLDSSLQSKLLRVLEEKEFERVGGNTLIPLHARVIAVTNANLEQQIEQGKFRSDLYYRLSAVEIAIPPLRDRKPDIPLLARHFLASADATCSFTPDALDFLMEYPWPGNVRQLRNMITKLIISEEGAVFDREILRRYLPSIPTSPAVPGQAASAAVPAPVSSIQAMERQLILDALQANRLNVSATAKSLGISRNTLYKKIDRYGIDIGRHLNI